MFKKQGLPVLSIMAILVLSVFLAGCEKAADKAIESASGGRAKIDTSKGTISIKTEQGTMEAGGTREWPSKIPSDVPKFTYGKITSVSETNTPKGTNILVGIQEVSPADFDKYKSTLESAGWKIGSTTKLEDGLLLDAKKEKSMLVVSFSGKGDKGFSGGVSFTEGK